MQMNFLNIDAKKYSAAIYIPFTKGYLHPQWIKMPDLIRKLVLTTDCWKQVNCAYFLSKMPVFALKICPKATKANEDQQRPVKSKTSKL